jgi:hypothetical protein
MPIKRKMMDALVKQYGKKKGRSIYFILERKRKKR